MTSPNHPSPPPVSSDRDHDHISDQPGKESTILSPNDATPKDRESGIESQVDHDPVLRGYRLYAVAIGVCFGALMMSLDISFLGTVRGPPVPPSIRKEKYTEVGQICADC
jgi:hypothetical protein